MTPIKMPKEQREAMIARVQDFFEQERGESIGNLAAEQFVDYTIRELGPYLYNAAIEDARHALLQKVSLLEEELYAIKKPERRV